MNFRHNYGSGHTIAEFSFGNSDGNDNYDLNVIEGFDIGMQIIPEDGGHVAECATANCTDAYHSSSDNHTYGVPSGSPFTLNLCQFDNVDSSSAASAPATTLTINNQCTDPVTVVKTVTGGAQTVQCQLAVGESCSQTYTTGVMNFRHNYGSGHTIAEFSFGNSNGNSNYDLNVIEGFDIGMQIIPEDGGHVAECATADCTDAYHSSSDNHTYGVPAGNPFTLNLCQFDAVSGDFNMTPDRHLGAAHVFAGLKPDLLITETTYASTIRDSKRARERDFLQKISDTVFDGGKVLIPVFALGRVQELCILLESYWERLGLKVPIYCSAGLADRATKYYRLFIGWTNEKIKKNFVQRNMFDFKHISPLDPSYVDAPGPMVVFSTPGMLHGGQSLRIFKKWCGDEKNLIIMPGYCTAGTVGAKVIAGAKKVMIDQKEYDVNMRVEYMSFSAHADAKGIMLLIRDVEPANVMFVHGEESKMEFLKGKVEKQFKIPVFKPANGETIVINTPLKVFVDIPTSLIQKSMEIVGPKASKKYCPIRGCFIMDNDTKKLQFVSQDEAANKLGVKLHSITFSEVFEMPNNLNLKQLAMILKKFDPELQEKTDGIDMFDSEVLIASVPNEPRQVEIIWDDDRENWLDVLVDEIGAKKIGEAGELV